jgi:hypothetical protein
MAQHPETAPKRARAPARRLVAVGAKGRRIARKLAQSTLLAAGLAAAQFSIPEIDPRYPVFDPTLVDRLHAPVTRYHE